MSQSKVQGGQSEIHSYDSRMRHGSNIALRLAAPLWFLVVNENAGWKQPPSDGLWQAIDNVT